MTVNLTRIYTKLGDAGETHLGDMSRVAKTHPRVEAYGEVDELNAQVGVTLTVDGLPDPYVPWLRQIQNDLFDLGADLSVPHEGDRSRLRVKDTQVTWLEERCDEVNTTLEPLKSFILPGGTAAAAHLHVCRTVCRRAERRTLIVEDGNPEVLRYLNRLSDLFFILSRGANGGDEPLWQPGKSPGVSRPLDAAAQAAARARQDQLVKPPGSLGRLEELAIWLAGATGEERPVVRARIVVAAADHGVSAEGVSAYPPEVTGQMLATFVSGRGAISVLSAAVGAELVCVDAGVRGDTTSLGPAVRQTGLEPSANLVGEPALSDPALELALETGRGLATAAARDGITVLVGGEMGIGNTTPATCLAAWLTGRPPAELAGPGTGLDADGVARKVKVVERALDRHAPTDARDALRCLGGGELAVLCGLALGAAEHGVGYLCDGVIATAAAAMAVAMDPGVLPWLVAGHLSPEPAHGALLAELGLDPILALGMRLGEASGATAALAILQLAAATHAEMATFAEAGVAGPPKDTRSAP